MSVKATRVFIAAVVCLLVIVALWWFERLAP
jgi:dolichyl-phosphate-mannose--protein O-mannosyl transferase